tara:strand:+ start:27 stop:209 length:183 start_codon:yes stop_codon:yes gene_type:complete
MKIKAKNGTLERVPGGLNKDLVKTLMSGDVAEVGKMPYKLIDLVDVVEDKQTTTKKKEVK